MTGILPSQHLKRMIAAGEVTGSPEIIPEQIQPASLDLRLGNVAWRVRASFLSGKGRSVADRLAEFEMHKVDLSDGAVLEKGCVYVVPLMEALALPEGTAAMANAKSSTGRLDLLTRLITDGGTEFDRIPAGYTGPLYAEICPRSFSVLVRPGMRLNQIRFRAGQAALSDDALRALHAETPLVSGRAVIEQGLGFSVDLSPGPDRLVGYRAKPHTGVIDLDRIDQHDPHEFWETVRTEDRQIILDPGAFYILVSREAVTIPRLCRRDGPLPRHGGGIPRALRRLLRSRFRLCRGRRLRLARGAGGALSRGALRTGGRAGRGPSGLREDGRTPRDPLRAGDRLELPGPGPEAVEAFPQRLRAPRRPALPQS